MQQSFSEFGVSARIVRALAERDITTPFPIQGVLQMPFAGGTSSQGPDPVRQDDRFMIPSSSVSS
jgi:hypothetical protein